MNIIYWNPRDEKMVKGFVVGNILIGDVKYISILNQMHKKVNIIPENVFEYTYNFDMDNNAIYNKDIVQYNNEQYVVLKHNDCYGVVIDETFTPLKDIKHNAQRICHINQLSANQSRDVDKQFKYFNTSLHENIFINIDIRNHFDFKVKRDIHEFVKSDNKAEPDFSFISIKGDDAERLYLERIVHYLSLMYSIYNGEALHFYLGNDFLAEVLSNKTYSLWKENNWTTKRGKRVIYSDLYEQISYYTNKMNVTFESISVEYSRMMINEKDRLERLA